MHTPAFLRAAALPAVGDTFSVESHDVVKTVVRRYLRVRVQKIPGIRIL